MSEEYGKLISNISNFERAEKYAEKLKNEENKFNQSFCLEAILEQITSVRQKRVSVKPPVLDRRANEQYPIVLGGIETNILLESIKLPKELEIKLLDLKKTPEGFGLHFSGLFYGSPGDKMILHAEPIFEEYNSLRGLKKNDKLKKLKKYVGHNVVGIENKTTGTTYWFN